MAAASGGYAFLLPTFFLRLVSLRRFLFLFALGGRGAKGAPEGRISPREKEGRGAHRWGRRGGSRVLNAENGVPLLPLIPRLSIFVPLEGKSRREGGDRTKSWGHLLKERSGL